MGGQWGTRRECGEQRATNNEQRTTNNGCSNCKTVARRSLVAAHNKDILHSRNISAATVV